MLPVLKFMLLSVPLPCQIKKMKHKLFKTIILSALLFAGGLVKAQHLDWVKPMLAIDNFDVVPQCIRVDKSGNLYAITNLRGKGVFGKDTIISDSPSSIVLSKYDTLGNLLKNVVIRKPATIFYTRDANFDDEGNIYIVGEFTTQKERSFIMKCDSNGRILWGKGAKGDVAGQTVTLDGKGNIFTGGYIQDSFIADTFKFKPKSRRWNSFVSRMDSSGNIKWVKFFFTYVDMAHTHGNLIGLNGSLYVSGHFTGTAYIDNFSIDSGVGMLMNLDTADGRVRFLVKDSPASDQKFYIYEDEIGNIYTCGIGKFSVSKFSYKGDVLPFIDSLGKRRFYPSAAGVNKDGQVLATYINNDGSMSAKLSDNTGKIIGSENFNIKGLYSIWRILPLGNHSFYFYGLWRDTFGYNGDTLIASLQKQEYQFIGKVTIPPSLWASVNTESFENESSFQLYPNPNDGSFSLHLSKELSGPLSLGIFNILGQNVYSAKYAKASQIISIQTKNLPKGQYILKARGGNTILNRKFIVN